MFNHPPGGDFESLSDSEKLICVGYSSPCPSFIKTYFLKAENELLENNWLINNFWTLSSYCNANISDNERIKGIIICYEDRINNEFSSESAILIRDFKYHFRSYEFIDCDGIKHNFSIRILYK